MIVNRLRIGRADEIDIAKVAVEFAEIVEPFLQFFSGERRAGIHAENLPDDEIRSAEQLHADEIKIAQRVQVAFGDNHRDIHAFAGPLLIDERYLQAVAGDIVNLFGMIDDARCEVTFRLIVLADTFPVFIKLGGIEGPCKEIFQ